VCASGAATAQSGGAPPTSAGSGVWTDLLIVLVLIGVNGLFAMTEAAFLTVRRTRIEQLVEEGHRSARLVADMLGDPTRTLSTIQVGITFVGLITAGAAADSAVEPVAAWLRSITGGALSASGAELAALVGVMVCVTFLTLVLGEITPKSLAVQRAEPIVLMAAFPLRGIQLVTAPAVELVTRIADILVRPFGGKAAFHPSAMSQEELKLMVEQSEEYGVIETAEKEMIHSIFEFSDTSVRRVMTPRLDITAVSADTTVHELIESVNASGHSRLPVYDGDLDQIVGVVHIKDVISDLAETGNAIVRNRMKPPYFVPESKRVDDLLADFRRNKSQLAIVRDEYGTVTGVVTIEDLIEEIVGEIQDEYDLEEPEVTQLDPSTLVVDGRMAVTDFNDRMGVEVPIEGADTLGGFVFGLMGHQPAQGEETVWSGITFRIEATDGRRIQKVRVTKGPAQSTGDGAATGTAEGA
jgi:putative hemolysin